MNQAHKRVIGGDWGKSDAVAWIARANGHPEPEALRVWTQIDTARACHHGTVPKHEDVIGDYRHAGIVQARKEGALARTFWPDDRPRTRASTDRAGVHGIGPVRQRDLGSDASQQRVHELAVSDVGTHA